MWRIPDDCVCDRFRTKSTPEGVSADISTALSMAVAAKVSDLPEEGRESETMALGISLELTMNAGDCCPSVCGRSPNWVK